MTTVIKASMIIPQVKNLAKVENGYFAPKQIDVKSLIEKKVDLNKVYFNPYANISNNLMNIAKKEDLSQKLDVKA